MNSLNWKGQTNYSMKTSETELKLKSSGLELVPDIKEYLLIGTVFQVLIPYRKNNFKNYYFYFSVFFIFNEIYIYLTNSKLVGT